MKAVLMSIQPKWCELIAKGKKTIEVRKTKPKIATPFKVYIYCTMGGLPKHINNENLEKESIYAKHPDIINGKVIGEFVCSNIAKGLSQFGSCLTMREVIEYANGKVVYGWCISDLVIYDKPKELSDFEIECKGGCDIPYLYDRPCINCNKNKLTRPPQSWCYVEELSK